MTRKNKTKKIESIHIKTRSISKKRKPTKKKQVTFTRVEATAPGNTSLVSRAPRVRLRKVKVTTPFDQYVKSLNDPFMVVPPPVGYGTMIPTIVSTAFARVNTPVGNTASAVVLIAALNTGLMVTRYEIATVNYSTAIAGYAVANTAAANGGVIAASGNQARKLSGGLRAMMRSNINGLPPTVYSGLIADTFTNIINLSVNGLLNLDSLQLVPTPTNEEGSQVLWRPEDFTDFQFSSIPLTTSVSLSAETYLVTMFLGLTPASGYNQISYDTIMHLELEPGATNGTETPDSVATTAKTDLEGMMRSASKLLAPAMSQITNVLTTLVTAGMTSFAREAFRTQRRAAIRDTLITCDDKTTKDEDPVVVTNTSSTPLYVAVVPPPPTPSQALDSSSSAPPLLPTHLVVVPRPPEHASIHALDPDLLLKISLIKNMNVADLKALLSDDAVVVDPPTIAL